jgi:D-alanyl-D-alanine carboxypeptidase (penicillin-binding protein 5/6)
LDDRSIGCTVRTAPPAPIDHSEIPKPGQATLGALPVPAKPVGGPRMGECADILPANAPPLPAGESSASWVLADMDTGQILAARDPHARERPASCLKVLTSLVVLDKLSMDTDVEGTQQDANVDGSRVGVGPQGHYTVRQLLTGLIMNSGNDAANALARQMGGVPATLAAMSAKARSLGALDTRPATPSGLDAQGMATSAYDLAVFYRVVMRDPTFQEISRTRLFQWPGHGDQPGFMISSDNKMLASYPGTIGGKTGFTDDARHTRIAAAERHGRRLEVVLMRGEQHPVPMDTQAARLLDYGFALPRTTPPVGQLVERAPSDSTDDANGIASTSDEATTPAAAPERQGNRNKALVTIGGGVLLGIALSVLIARRRRPDRGGRHTVQSMDD